MVANVKQNKKRSSQKSLKLKGKLKLKIIVEEHPDGYVAYPIGLEGVVVGQGDTFEEALADVTSACQFHIQTFGSSAIRPRKSVVGVYLAETRVAV